MLNREELEFIWETQPHGYFPKLVKELKARANLNKYLVKARVIQVNHIELDSKEMEVYASSYGAKEIEKAKEKLRRELLSNSSSGLDIVLNYEIKMLT